MRQIELQKKRNIKRRKQEEQTERSWKQKDQTKRRRKHEKKTKRESSTKLLYCRVKNNCFYSLASLFWLS